MADIIIDDNPKSPQPPTIDRQALLSQFGAEASWQQTLQNALTIARREVRDSFRDWRIMVPIFLLTLVFPALANVGTNRFFNVLDQYGGDAEEITTAFLPLMPMIVGFFPISISLVIALESFVGEKERRSLEPLLATPLTNLELYIGKVLSSTIPPIMASYFGMFVYISIMVLGPIQWRPDAIVILQIVVLTTIQAIAMVTGSVVISSQTTSTRAANLLASFVIIPISLLTILESTIIIQTRNRYILWYIAAAMVIVVFMLIRIGIKTFNREQLLGQAIDNLNIKWMGNMVRLQFLELEPEDIASLKEQGQRPNPIRWYRRAIRPAFHRGQNVLRFTTYLTIGSVLVGIAMAFMLGWEIAPVENTSTMFSEIDLADTDNLLGAILANMGAGLRSALLFLILGSISFGVVPLFFASLVGIAIGGFIGASINGGLTLMPFAVVFGPYALIIVIILIMVAAFSMRVGVSITKTEEERPIGEIWLRSFGDALKILVGVVVPLYGLLSVFLYLIMPSLLDLYS